MQKRSIGMLILFALTALAGLVLVIGLSFIAVVGWPSSQPEPTFDAAIEQIQRNNLDGVPYPEFSGTVIPPTGFKDDYYEWLDGPANSPFPEESDTAVREMKTIGLHCMVVEQLPLFDDFMMFSPEGDAYVKALVQQRALQIEAQLDPDASRDERGIAVWRDDWYPMWPDEDWCLDELDRGRTSGTGAP